MKSANSTQSDNSFSFRRDTGEKTEYYGYCILQAEDMEINRQIFSIILAPFGLKVECAETGLEAVRMFRNAPRKYSIIFMDMEMPIMDGCEATRQIRALDVPRAKTIPIIALTSHTSPVDIAKCLKAGMNAHLIKPYDRTKIVEILRKYL